MDTNTIILTGDGSHTVYNQQVNEHYHSTFGAINESKHIFIQAGLDQIGQAEINVLEIGFGTGLNALLTIEWALKTNRKINYTGIEAFPISDSIVEQLNYPVQLQIDEGIFHQLHSASNKRKMINDNFLVQIKHEMIQDSQLPDSFFDIVFFDAFSPEVQPEMWNKKVFIKISNSLKSGGYLLTYSCKGMVRRNLSDSGFTVEKLPGPPGKREFVRAKKTLNALQNL